MGRETASKSPNCSTEVTNKFPFLFPTSSCVCPTSDLLEIYGGLVGGLVLFAFLFTVLFFFVCVRASKNLHNSMFGHIIYAPMKFFDTNPMGRILNRFGKDLGQVDDTLPIILLDTVLMGLNVIGVLIVVACVKYYILIPTVILALIFYYYRQFYLRSAREIQRLEAISCSPVFSHLTTTLQGLVTIRAYKKQEMFQSDFDSYKDVHTSAFHLRIATTRWFSGRLEFLCGCYITVLTFGIIGLRMTNASAIGLAVSSASSLFNILQYWVRQTTDLENQMISVERVMEYTSLETETPIISPPGKAPPQDWPSAGDIVFDHVWLRYYPDDPPVLKDVCFSISAGEKIGIVGRTGAGKSSLLHTLFRLISPTGSIVIDGVEVLKIGLADLRSRLAVIPQEPVFFSGTLRYNLDPFDTYTDTEIWKALEEVQLRDAITMLPNGIDTPLMEGGENFSVGQRQLLCLGRAILKRSKIIVLDEATANIDMNTDALIQRTIRSIFSHCTVLTVAHRLLSIMDSDRVLVMDSGKVKEFDKPLVLLRSEDSLFKEMVDEASRGTSIDLYKVAEKQESK